MLNGRPELPFLYLGTILLKHCYEWKYFRYFAAQQTTHRLIFASHLLQRFINRCIVFNNSNIFNSNQFNRRMKRLSTLLFGILITAWVSAQVTVTSYPYLETFDSFQVDNVTFGPGSEPFPAPNGLFPNGWSNDQTGDGNQDWYGRSTGTGSGGTGPVSDHTSGNGVYIFLEDGFGNNTDINFLSPFFDLTGVGSNVILEYWAHSQTTANPGNKVLLDIWLQSTQTWVLAADSIGVIGANWTLRSVNLSPYQGDTIQLRWRGSNNVTSFTHDIAIDDVNIYETVLTAVVDPFQPTCFGDSTGAANVNITFGQAPYTVMWSNGDTTDTTVTGLPAGPVSVTVIDALGDTTMGVDTITAFPELFTNTTDYDLLCFGDTNGIASAAVSGGTPFGGYIVDTSGMFAQLNGVGTPLTLGDDQVSPAIALPFTFTFFNVDYTDIYVSSNGFAGFDAGTGSGCCTGQNLPNTNAPNNVIAFAWEDLNPNLGTSSIRHFTVGSAPNRIWVLEFMDVHLCCTATNPTVSMQMHLHESSNIIEIHTISSEFTAGNNATMGIENGDGTEAYVRSGRNNASWGLVTTDYTAFIPVLPYNYTWSAPGGTDSALVNLGVGSYTVSVADANGCTQVTTVNVNEPAPLAATLSTTDVTCNGLSDATATVTTTGSTMPYFYLWSDSTVLDSNVGNDVSTVLSVTVSDTFGCDTITFSNITFTEPDPLVSSITASTDVNCVGGSDGDATVAAVGGTTPYVFSWNDPANQMGTAATNLSAGSYGVVVTDANGCTDSSSVTLIELNPLPTPFLGNDTTTFEDDFLLLNPGNFTSYVWYNLNTGPTEKVSSTGTYYVTVTDSNGCSNSDSINVIVPFPVGLNDVDENVSMHVYPNPGNGQLQVRLQGLEGEKVTFTATDLQGRMVFEQIELVGSATDVITIDLSNQAKGIYMLKVQSDDRSAVTRVGVQ